jgi:hypothetical protein
MKKSDTIKAKRGSGRDLFAELTGGMEALADCVRGSERCELMWSNTNQRRR